MTSDKPTCPASKSRVVELYFLEHRAKLIDIASFLDRVDRAPADGPEPDFRVEAFRRALAILDDGEPQRARRVLELLSDHSTTPIESAAGMKGAFGACPE
ncbi:MAG: hypothetical protein V3S08_06445 [Phycisphaerales bacterium]